MTYIPFYVENKEVFYRLLRRRVDWKIKPVEGWRQKLAAHRQHVKIHYRSEE